MTKVKSLTEGPIFSRLFLFTLPIMASGLLQVFYNMADNIVVGSFSGDALALAAAGSTSTLTALIINFLTGFATGSGVIIAQCYGAKNHSDLHSSLHTASVISIVGGLFLAAVAFIFSEPLLTLMGTKPELMSRALLYFRIICIGIPASTVFNFGAAFLRSFGDSKKPLYILATTGLINVLLNLFFVIVCHMAVEGVALATITAQYLSASAVTLLMLRQSDENCRVYLNKLHVDIRIFKRILKIAIPASLQSSLFAISNIFIQSGTNQLLTAQVTAKTISGSIDGLVYTAINAYSHTSMTFVAQNYGAKRIDRVKKAIIYTLIQVTLVGVILGQLILFFGNEMVSLFIDPLDPNKALVTEYTLEVMRLILNIYFMCGIMDSLSGILRGLGNAFAPMIIGISGVCILRMAWLIFFFPMEMFHTLTGVYLCYPITWIFCITALTIVLLKYYRKIKKRILSSELQLN